MTGLSGRRLANGSASSPRRARQSHRPPVAGHSARLGSAGAASKTLATKSNARPTSAQSPITTHSPRSLRRVPTLLMYNRHDDCCFQDAAGAEIHLRTHSTSLRAPRRTRTTSAPPRQHRPRHPQLRARQPLPALQISQPTLGIRKRQMTTCPITTNCKPKKPSPSACPPTTPP